MEVVASETDVDTANAARRVAVGSVGMWRDGTAVLQPDGRTVRFTPAADANSGNTPGGFGFTYRVTDGSATSAGDGTVTVTVTAVNDAPVAVNDSYRDRKSVA